MTPESRPAEPADKPSASDLEQAWRVLSLAERAEAFLLLPPREAEDFFLGLRAGDQASLILGLPEDRRRSWLRLLAPDDADVIQAAPGQLHAAWLGLLDDPTRHEVRGLLAYAEDRAGGLMDTRFARVRPDMTVDEAIAYLRKQGRERVETIYYSYVLDEEQRLLGVVSFREFFDADASARVRDVMRTAVVAVTAETPQDEVSRLFIQTGLIAIPVVDAERHMQGIVTVDDIVHVVAEQATEEIQRIGGSEVLGAP
jgi:magnesium transporter